MADGVLLTTYKVVIDADDMGHARRLVEALSNDGYHAHYETHELVEKDGQVTLHRMRNHDAKIDPDKLSKAYREAGWGAPDDDDGEFYNAVC